MERKEQEHKLSVTSDVQSFDYWEGSILAHKLFIIP